MTRVVIVGEIYNADLTIGGGPIIPPSQPPLGIWGPTDPRPTHPIAPGGSPPGIWGPPGPWPTPPIAWPPQPGQPPYPDHGLPPFPSHPIAPGGPGGGGQPPLGIWGGGNQPFPTPPIYIPGQPVLPDSGDPTKAHVVVYVPGQGAVSFTVDLSQLPEPTPPTEPEPK